MYEDIGRGFEGQSDGKEKTWIVVRSCEPGGGNFRFSFTNMR